MSTPLGMAMLLDTLRQAGLPPGAVLPVGLGLLLMQVVLDAAVLGVLLAAAVVWQMGKRQ